MQTHDLKIRKPYLDALRSGDKKCEIRFNDRNFQVGDDIYFFQIFEDIVLRDKRYGPYKITHVLSFLGLQEGYVALSLEKRGDIETIPTEDYRGNAPTSPRNEDQDVPF